MSIKRALKLIYKYAINANSNKAQCEKCNSIDDYADDPNNFTCWKCGHKNANKSLKSLIPIFSAISGGYFFGGEIKNLEIFDKVIAQGRLVKEETLKLQMEVIDNTFHNKFIWDIGEGIGRHLNLNGVNIPTDKEIPKNICTPRTDNNFINMINNNGTSTYQNFSPTGNTITSKHISIDSFMEKLFATWCKFNGANLNPDKIGLGARGNAYLLGSEVCGFGKVV